MKDYVINLALDFSKTPGARYPEEGEYSGQEFRKKFLFPKMTEALNSKQSLTVILDGTFGLGTSFLEESFGGLIRENRMDYHSILNSLVLVSNESPHYKEEILEYLKEAYEKEYT